MTPVTTLNKTALRRGTSLISFTGLVPPPKIMRPNGISAVTMARNEEDWLELSVQSIIDSVDEVVLADHGSDDSTPELATHLAGKYPDKIRVVDLHGLDFVPAINLMLGKTRYRWILRWHADFVAHTSGPNSIQALRRRVLAVSSAKHFCSSLSGVALDGDLEHQYRERRDPPEPFLYTYSPWLRYYQRLHWEGLHVPWFYARITWPEVYYFHMRRVKSSIRLLQTIYWSRWFDERVRNSQVTLREFIETHATRDYGSRSVEEAARKAMLEYFSGCLLFSRDECGDYPDLLKPLIRNPPYRLVYRGGTLVDRVEPNRPIQPKQWILA